MIYVSLLILAVIPSFIWLLFFLRRDDHPESKTLITFIFLLGILSGIIAYFFQTVAVYSFESLIEITPSIFLFVFFFYQFIVIALSEEALKYIAVLATLKGNLEFDEPIDIVIYMITAGLGFAAIENLLYLSLFKDLISIAQIALFRFLSSTLLHALASGIFGAFLVYRYKYESKWFIVIGLIVATLLHGFYNIIASKITVGTLSFAHLAFYLVFLLVAFLIWIKIIKKNNGICFKK